MESIQLHTTPDKYEANERCLEMLGRVGIPNPKERVNYYPHQLSGGLRQRAMIAMALACDPRLLIADEPTTALDVTVQAQILDLINTLQESMGMSVLYITHDLGVIASIASEVAVMYLGKIVERASTREIFKNPLHPYTVRLMQSLPKSNKRKGERLAAIKGNVPVPLNMPPQCGFCSRCEEAIDNLCEHRTPALVEIEPEHYVRCFNFSREEEPND
jgi:oligopeptide/dipeptide ABC transporter ATP-binding protein